MINNLLTHIWFMNFFIDIAKHILYSKRIYRSTSADSILSDLADAIYAIKGIRLGMEIFKSHSIPLFLISWETIVITQIDNVGLHAETCATFTVYRWNWGLTKGLPIIPDIVKQNTCNGANIIHVLETSGNRIGDMYLSRRAEIVLPTSGIDTNVLNTSKSVANAIVDDYIEGNKAAKVYVLHGRPGCGKSTTIRLITQMISAI